MNANVGMLDRIIRIAIGVVIAALGIVFKSWFGLIAIIPLATALVGRCGAYLPFGINTCKTGVQDDEKTGDEKPVEEPQA